MRLEQSPLGDRRGHREVAVLPVLRGDRTGGQLVLGGSLEDHAAVPEVRLGRAAGLAPLEAHEGHQVRVVRVAGQGVAGADALLGGLPVGGQHRLRVVREREEVEARAVAREVAGVGRRMRALAAHQRDREQEAVPRVAAVHVEVAEQDLLLRRPRVGPRRQLHGGGLAGAGRGLHVSTPRLRDLGVPTLQRSAGDAKQGENEKLPSVHARTLLGRAWPCPSGVSTPASAEPIRSP